MMWFSGFTRKHIFIDNIAKHRVGTSGLTSLFQFSWFQQSDYIAGHSRYAGFDGLPVIGQ